MTMENTNYVALSHQMALQRQMDIIAHNIANANTTAFKSDAPMFEEYLINAGANTKISFVQDYGTLTNFTEGPMEFTGNNYDVALQGPGFFVVNTPQGRMFTRDGHFGVNSNGFLSTAQGDAVLDDRGQAILADPALGRVTINGDGTLSIGTRPPVRLAVVDFANNQLLHRAGAGYFSTTQTEQAVAQPKVVQGTIEGSNVTPILELTRMIETTRAYEASQRLIDVDHDLQRKVADRMPKLRS